MLNTRGAGESIVKSTHTAKFGGKKTTDVPVWMQPGLNLTVIREKRMQVSY